MVIDFSQNFFFAKLWGYEPINVCVSYENMCKIIKNTFTFNRAENKYTQFLILKEGNCRYFKYHIWGIWGNF